MKNFSIKELETFCGIKAHTIRIWEQRYGVFQPQRTGGNARRYSIDELSKVLHLSLLNKNGYRISQICNMPEDDLQKKVEALTKGDERIQRAINELIICMYKIDSTGFETVLNDCFLSWPVQTVVDEIIFPFLSKVGLLCQGRQMSEEHLVVTAIRKKLHWSIERIDVTKPNNKSILLFLSGERQLDLLLLYMYYHLKRDGWDVIYMGVDISLKNLEELLSIKKTDYLLTYLPNKHPISLEELSLQMKRLAPQSTLLIIETRPFLAVQKFDNIKTVSPEEAMSCLYNKTAPLHNALQLRTVNGVS